MNARLFAILAAIAIFFTVLSLIRQKRMSFKYSVSWLSASLTAIILSLYPPFLKNLSEWAGFALPSNFIFFMLLVFSVVLSLLLTIYINEQNNRTETLAQKVGILEHELSAYRTKASKDCSSQ